jgi:peroxiredoxin
MYTIKYQIFALLVLPIVALFVSSCTTWQRLPDIETADASIYIKRCGVCHAVPHPSRLKYHHWKDKIVAMESDQMPVITAQEKESVLSYIKGQSKKDLKTYKLRCGKCHEEPEVESLIPEKWEDLIVVLDGNMPVFSEQERLSVVRYLQAFAKKEDIETEESMISDTGMQLPKVRKEIPYFELKDVEGGPFSTNDLKDKVAIIHFWATWCEPCREELPTLQSLWNKIGHDSIKVIGVVSDKDKVTNVKDFVSKLNLTFPIVLDSGGSTFDSYLVKALPTTYIVGKDGKFLARAVGSLNWGDEALEKYIQEMAEK